MESEDRDYQLADYTPADDFDAWIAWYYNAPTFVDYSDYDLYLSNPDDGELGTSTATRASASVSLPIGSPCFFSGAVFAGGGGATPDVSDFMILHPIVAPGPAGGAAVLGEVGVALLRRLLGAGAKVAPKLLNQFNSVDSLLLRLTKLERLKGGVRMGTITGDGESIFKAITNGGKRLPNGLVKMPDGTLIGRHIATSTAEFTIDINRAGQLFKVRVVSFGSASIPVQ